MNLPCRGQSRASKFYLISRNRVVGMLRADGERLCSPAKFPNPELQLSPETRVNLKVNYFLSK